jgi:ABC-type sugar transport system substrate-binding protein
MKKAFLLLSIGAILLLSVIVIMLLGLNGMLESLVHAIGLSTVIILFLIGFSLLFLSLVDRMYMRELKNIMNSLEIVSRDNIDLTYRFNEKGIGDVFALSKQLNILFSLLHNYIFKLKRVVERNGSVGSQLLKHTDNLKRFWENSAEIVDQFHKREQKNLKHIQNTRNTIQELKRLFSGISVLEGESVAASGAGKILKRSYTAEPGNQDFDFSVLVNSLFISIEKAEKYLDIAENSLLDSEAMSERYAREFMNISYVIDAINNTACESGFNNHYLKVTIDKLGTLDTGTLKSTDGIPLLGHDYLEPNYVPIGEDPRRPDNPGQFPLDDARHWYDHENAGWGVEKINIPVSPVDGAEGKLVTLLVWEHYSDPYTGAYIRGMAKMAGAFGINLNYKIIHELRESKIEELFTERPDLLIVYTENAYKLTQFFHEVNSAGIPLIVGNSSPNDEGMKFALGACGPNDWGMGRLLAGKLAELCGYEGGYCLFRSHPETQKYVSRTYSIITELKKIAPNMTCLDMQPCLERDGAKMVMTEWLNRFGDDLVMVASSSPGECLAGMNDAVRKFKKSSIIRGAFGNSLLAQQFMKEGRLQAMVWQSAEGEGAMALEMAIDWLNGLDITPIRYLPMKIITHETVDQYFPAQW